MAMPELTSEQMGYLCEEVDELVVELERVYRTLVLAKTVADAKAAIDPTKDAITMRYSIEAFWRLPQVLDQYKDIEPAHERFLSLAATPAGLRVWGAVQRCCRRGLNIQQHESARADLREELARWRCDQQRRAGLTADAEVVGFLIGFCEREGSHEC